MPSHGSWNELTALNGVVYDLSTICLAIMYTWVFHNTKGSVLMAILIHASFNASAAGILAPLFPAPILNDYGLLPILGGFGAFAVVLVALARGRLGYRPEAEATLTDTTGGAAHVR